MLGTFGRGSAALSAAGAAAARERLAACAAGTYHVSHVVSGWGFGV